jgi:opacity protein-like surface antigen
MKPIVFGAVLLVCLASTSFAQEVPRFELYTGATNLRDPGAFNAYGWMGSLGTNINKWFSVKAEAAGYYNGTRGENIHSVLVGPQFTLRRDGSRIQPFAHFLVGAQRDYDFRFPFPFTVAPTTYAAIVPGGGVDISLNSKFSLRFGADYMRSIQFDRFDKNRYRANAGVVFKFR